MQDFKDRSLQSWRKGDTWQDDKGCSLLTHILAGSMGGLIIVAVILFAGYKAGII